MRFSITKDKLAAQLAVWGSELPDVIVLNGKPLNAVDEDFLPSEYRDVLDQILQPVPRGMLAYLIQNDRATVEELSDFIRNDGNNTVANKVAVQVSALRRQLKIVGAPLSIRTLRSLGGSPGHAMYVLVR